MGGKAVARADEPDEVMAIDDSSGEHLAYIEFKSDLLAAVSIVLPPSLPRCTLVAAFQCSETNADIPPAFYPGQAIPTILTFTLDRFSSLPHALNPTLTMSLVGTLHMPNLLPRTIICVSVSLSEGLELWARDAEQAYAIRPPNDCLCDPKLSLPGGTYSLPLTVQVPSTPRLPPSFSVRGASFAVTYALSVTLTCNEPLRAGSRVVLAEAAQPFEMMPETMPTRAPRYNPSSFWVRSDLQNGVVGTAKGLIRKTNTRWTVEPKLPTTAFSPTSVIPLSLKLCPPTDSEPIPYQILIRLCLIRREHSHSAPSDKHDPLGEQGLLHEEEIISRHAWVESDGIEPINLNNILIPLLLDGDRSWTHGFSTTLNVGLPSNANPASDQISVSSTFHLATTLAFLVTDFGTLNRYIHNLPEQGVFTEPVLAKHDTFNLALMKKYFPGTMRTLPLPIVIGSVSEPRSAMHSVRWSDLHVDRSSGQEVGRMVNGEAITCEDGWIVPPPAYGDAIKSVPYEW